MPVPSLPTQRLWISEFFYFHNYLPPMQVSDSLSKLLYTKAGKPRRRRETYVKGGESFFLFLYQKETRERSTDLTRF